MSKGKKKNKPIKILDDRVEMPERAGNGIITMQISVDNQGKLVHYSLAYINHRLCGADNGRVLGYDNSHGYHHRHYMGKEEPVEFVSYDETFERFEQEWRSLHEKAKKRHH